jgi:hypothetical protein
MNQSDKEFVTVASMVIIFLGAVGISCCIGDVVGEVWGWFTISLIASVCGLVGLIFSMRAK